MFSIGNEELAHLQDIREDDLIICPHCKEYHPVRCSTDAKTGQKSNMLMAYKCNDKSYIAAVNGKLLNNLTRA